MQGKIIKSPHLVHLPNMLHAGLVDVIERWLVVAAMVSPLASGEVEQQASLSTSWWTHQHTLDWLTTCHITD